MHIVFSGTKWYFLTKQVFTHQDIVDILIGWYLEPDLSDSLVTQMTNALISLNEYWKVNMHWCKVLTGQFLDDADGFCSECISLPPAHPDLNTKLHKITLLVR